VAPKLKEIGGDWSDEEEEEEEDMEETVAAAAPLEADTASDALTHDVGDAGHTQMNKNEGSFIALLFLYCVDSEVCIVLAVVFLSQGYLLTSRV